MVCDYCGRVMHRCTCERTDSRLRRFIARDPDSTEYVQRWREKPYKRGVPPQVKRRERARLRSQYALWYATLVEQYGERCLNCGMESDLVLDHVIPVAKGGQSVLENLQLLCAECNRLKGKLVIDCRR